MGVSEPRSDSSDDREGSSDRESNGSGGSSGSNASSRSSLGKLRKSPPVSSVDSRREEGQPMEIADIAAKSTPRAAKKEGGARAAKMEGAGEPMEIADIAAV